MLKTVTRLISSPHFHTGFLTWPGSCRDPASQTQLVLAAPLCSQYATKEKYKCEDTKLMLHFNQQVAFLQVQKKNRFNC